MSRIGLTGGIGSGKSTVARLLVARGARLIDADQIARSLTEPQGAALAPIAQAFGADMILLDGTLNRARLREQVFNDAAARQRLEGITHPLVAQAIGQALADRADGVALLDIPLLVESTRWRPALDAVVVVDCSVETQMTRVRERNGWPEDTIAGVIRSQASRARRLAAADAVIHNDHIGLEALAREVEQLAGWLGL